MGRLILLCALAAAVPAAADPALRSERDEIAEGLDLLSEGARRVLGGLISEIEPGLRSLRGKLGDFERRRPDLPGTYHAPEILPNGDIIIRRKFPFAPVGPRPDERIDI